MLPLKIEKSLVQHLSPFFWFFIEFNRFFGSNMLTTIDIWTLQVTLPHWERDRLVVVQAARTSANISEVVASSDFRYRTNANSMCAPANSHPRTIFEITKYLLEFSNI